MTDLEIIKHCAEAMGYSVVKGDARYKNGMAIATKDGEPITNYDPLKHDAQAMALVKQLCLRVQFTNHRVWVGDYNPLHWLAAWSPHPEDGIYQADARNLDLNRAICECVVEARRLMAKFPSFTIGVTPDDRGNR